MSVCVSGEHLYRSVIVLSIRVRGRTYIDRPSHCHVMGPHLYQSVIVLSVWVGAAPISIDHLFVISVCVFRTAPILIGHSSFLVSLVFGTVAISIGHHLVSLSFRVGTTPISISHFPCQFAFGAAPISIGHLVIILSVWVLARSAPISIGHYFVRFSWVLFDFESPSFFSFGILSHCAYSSRHFESSCFPSFWAFRVILFTWLLGAYRLFLIALLDFPLPLQMT